MNQKEKELEGELQGFCGTQDYWRHPFGIVYTDGVQFLAQQAHAYWLVDAIASHQNKPKVRQEAFQVWTLTVDAERRAILTGTDGDKGDGAVVLVEQAIPYTDFPLPFVRLYLEDGSLDGETLVKILLLPSEH